MEHLVSNMITNIYFKEKIFYAQVNYILIKELIKKYFIIHRIIYNRLLTISWILHEFFIILWKFKNIFL